MPIGALREGTEQRAAEFCARQGKGMLLLGDQTSKPPYILGNFPRIEIVFACVDKPNAARGRSGGDEQYAKLSNLKKLLDQGAITQGEFEKEKAKILSQY